MAKTRNRSTESSGAARGGLGRGLDALLGDLSPADAPAKAEGGVEEPSDTEPPADARRQATLPIEFLRANPDQPRRVFNEDALAELAESISARGMLQPILVRPVGTDNYEIVAGERRWRAAQRAQLHEVPVIIRTLTDEETAEIALIENVQRVDLNAVEEAQAYQRLSEHYGRTQEEIARAVGKSRSHVANIMRLLMLPERCLDALRANEITMGHARALLGAPDPDASLGAVLARGLSVRDTERLVQSVSGRPNASRRRAPPDSEEKQADAASGLKDADTRALENDLAAALGLEVSIDHQKGAGGEVRIKYLTLDQLDDVTRRLMGAGV
ncbi:MAG: ParB/RepB/Spo0J family partition protein [Pseudomonadota bacterium]